MSSSGNNASRLRRRSGRPSTGLVSVLAAATCVAGFVPATLAQGIQQPNWDEPFQPIGLYGEFSTFVRLGPNRFLHLCNVYRTGAVDGLCVNHGTSPTQWRSWQLVAPNAIINDVLGPDGKPASSRMFTRPTYCYHPDIGFLGLVCVAKGYYPSDGQLIPALVQSPTTQPGTFHYLGKLGGEPMAYGARRRVWTDGGSIFYQPDRPATWDPTNPLNHRYLVYLNGFGQSLALLYSVDRQHWRFFRRNGKIVSLLPFLPVGGCFPTVVRVRPNRWLAWMSLDWPPRAIYRLVSDDGLNWRMHDSSQPEIRREAWPSAIKAMRVWLDPDTQVLHGYVSVWVPARPYGYYRHYHSTTRRF